MIHQLRCPKHGIVGAWVSDDERPHESSVHLCEVRLTDRGGGEMYWDLPRCGEQLVHSIATVFA